MDQRYVLAPARHHPVRPLARRDRRVGAALPFCRLHHQHAVPFLAAHPPVRATWRLDAIHGSARYRSRSDGPGRAGVHQADLGAAVGQAAAAFRAASARDMTSVSKHDVVIVGASVAGCTAATLYARQGLKVALVDRETSPDYYKKICNHFIQPFAVDAFKRLGIVDTLESAGAVRNGDIRVYTRWGCIHAMPDHHSQRQPYGYNIR